MIVTKSEYKKFVSYVETCLKAERERILALNDAYSDLFSQLDNARREIKQLEKLVSKNEEIK